MPSIEQNIIKILEPLTVGYYDPGEAGNDLQLGYAPQDWLLGVLDSTGPRLCGATEIFTNNAKETAGLMKRFHVAQEEHVSLILRFTDSDDNQPHEAYVVAMLPFDDDQDMHCITCWLQFIR